MVVSRQRRERVEIVTINRPEARNAINFVDTAASLAEHIRRNAPLAVRPSKKIVKASLDLSEGEAWALSASALMEVFSSPDDMEGPRAFAEKREPRWNGIARDFRWGTSAWQPRRPGAIQLGVRQFTSDVA